MPHWRILTERNGPWLYEEHLQGKEIIVTIEKVVAGEVEGEKGRKAKKAVLHFVGKKRPLAINATNGKTIAALYGNMTEAWVGKRITLYPATTKDGTGAVVPCIRVRPSVPRGAADTTPEPEPPAQEGAES